MKNETEKCYCDNCENDAIDRVNGYPICEGCWWDYIENREERWEEE